MFVLSFDELKPTELSVTLSERRNLLLAGTEKEQMGLIA
jgi:hypothetical protein